jgi:hypothetical protein
LPADINMSAAIELKALHSLKKEKDFSLDITLKRF